MLGIGMNGEQLYIKIDTAQRGNYNNNNNVVLPPCSLSSSPVSVL